MSPPSRAQQVAEVMRFLDSDRNEGRDLKVIATEIVDGYHEFLMAGVKKPATPLRLGMLLKSPYDGKVRRVAHLDDAEGVVWIVHETSSYGWLGPLLPATWEYCEEFRQSEMRDTGEIGPNGKPKRKRYELTDEETDQAWSNPDWKPGDRLSQRQREHLFEVIATGPQCVLMRQADGGLLVDSNKNLEQYYKRESKLGSDW